MKVFFIKSEFAGANAGLVQKVVVREVSGDSGEPPAGYSECRDSVPVTDGFVTLTEELKSKLYPKDGE